MKISRTSWSLTAALALALGSAAALAQSPAPKPHEMDAMGQKDMAHDSMMHKMPSMHTMPATVTSVDMKTGVVDVDSEGMSLKVHFPPATVADLKTGDKITLHMGFSK